MHKKPLHKNKRNRVMYGGTLHQNIKEPFITTNHVEIRSMNGGGTIVKGGTIIVTNIYIYIYI